MKKEDVKIILTAEDMSDVTKDGCIKNNDLDEMINIVQDRMLERAKEGKTDCTLYFKTTDEQAKEIIQFFANVGFKASYVPNVIGSAKTFKFNWGKEV